MKKRLFAVLIMTFISLTSCGDFDHLIGKKQLQEQLDEANLKIEELKQELKDKENERTIKELQTKVDFLTEKIKDLENNEKLRS